ncbi:MAG: hypothetical protein KIT82_23485 [Bradyrhizobium sp.]|nr:hypothetical protein [Bradyrhizobium sp.]
MKFTESVVEDATLAWLETIGCEFAHGPDIAPDLPTAERTDYGEVVLAQHLRDVLARSSPTLPTEAPESAFRKPTNHEGADLLHRNRALHRLLVDGVTVEYRLPAGQAADAEGASAMAPRHGWSTSTVPRAATGLRSSSSRTNWG